MMFKINNKIFDNKKHNKDSVIELGAFKVIFTEVINIPESNAVHFIGITDKNETLSFRIYYKNIDGSDNTFGISKIENLMSFRDINNITPVNGHFEEFENMEIGVLVNPYRTKKGFVNLGHICWFDIQTRQTIWEKIDDNEAIYVDTKLEKLRGLNDE